MSAADLLLLSAIRLQPGAGVSELARSQGVGRSVVSEQATRLESAGLVRRDLNDGDARRVGLSLTDAGVTAFGAAAQRREAWLAARLKFLSASEQEVLSTAVALLDRLADAGSNDKQRQREGRHG